MGERSSWPKANCLQTFSIRSYYYEQLALLVCRETVVENLYDSCTISRCIGRKKEIRSLYPLRPSKVRQNSGEHEKKPCSTHVTFERRDAKQSRQLSRFLTPHGTSTEVFSVHECWLHQRLRSSLLSSRNKEWNGVTQRQSLEAHVHLVLCNLLAGRVFQSATSVWWWCERWAAQNRASKNNRQGV